MNVHVLRAIAALLESDETLTKNDKQTILAICHEPRRSVKPPEATLPRLFTVKDVRAALGVSRTLLWRLTKSGALPSVKVRRALKFRQQDIERFITESTVRQKRQRG